MAALFTPFKKSSETMDIIVQLIKCSCFFLLYSWFIFLLVKRNFFSYSCSVRNSELIKFLPCFVTITINFTGFFNLKLFDKKISKDEKVIQMPK